MDERQAELRRRGYAAWRRRHYRRRMRIMASWCLLAVLAAVVHNLWTSG